MPQCRARSSLNNRRRCFRFPVWAKIGEYRGHVEASAPESRHHPGCEWSSSERWINSAHHRIDAGSQMSDTDRRASQKSPALGRACVSRCETSARWRNAEASAFGAEVFCRKRRETSGAVGRLRQEAFERLVGFLGEIGAKIADLGRFRNAPFVSALEIVALHFV